MELLMTSSTVYDTIRSCVCGVHWLLITLLGDGIVSEE